jgi:hypothetical protein
MGFGSSVEEEQKLELELELHWDGFVTKSISAPKVLYSTCYTYLTRLRKEVGLK